MSLYSEDQLNALPVSENLEQAFKDPEKVVRLRVCREEDRRLLLRIFEFENLQELSVSLTDVSEMLPILPRLRQLQKLSMQACEVDFFPEVLFQLSNLRFLGIGNNSLSELPEEVSCLECLEEINFSQNELTRIPESVSRLSRLKSLNLSYNELESIPSSIGDIKFLEWLFLNSNLLREIPKEFGDLKNLKSLSLSYNQLQTLPDSIADLQKLKYFSIENNPFKSLPAELSKLTGIENFSIEAEKRPMFMDWTYKHSENEPQVELNELQLYLVEGAGLRDSVVEIIRRNGLTPLCERILSLARNAIEIVSTIPDDYSVVGKSRLGGFPDLQDETLFPKTDGRFWSFLAQINLADIATNNNYLPRTGLLAFFIDSTENFNARVLYFSGESCELKVVRHGGGQEMYEPQDDYTQNPHQVEFQQLFSLPFELSDEDLDEDLREIYADSEDLHESVDHQINGYTFTQHESPQHVAAGELGGQAEEWVPLLQLGWDSKVGFCFWDAGTLSFSIHQEDLRRRDFSRIHVSLESS